MNTCCMVWVWIPSLPGTFYCIFSQNILSTTFMSISRTPRKYWKNAFTKLFLSIFYCNRYIYFGRYFWTICLLFFGHVCRCKYCTDFGNNVPWKYILEKKIDLLRKFWSFYFLYISFSFCTSFILIKKKLFGTSSAFLYHRFSNSPL